MTAPEYCVPASGNVSGATTLNQEDIMQLNPESRYARLIEVVFGWIILNFPHLF